MTLRDTRRDLARSVHLIAHGPWRVRAWDTAPGPPGHTARRLPTGDAHAPERPTFVVITGLGLGSRSYTAIAGALAEHGRVVVLDLVGFDSLHAPEQALSIEEHAATVRRVLRELDLRDPVLVGHSMGTQIAVEAVREHPTLASRLVLVSPCVVPERRTVPATLTAFGFSSVRERLGAALVAVRGGLHTGLGWTLENLPPVVTYPLEERIEGLGGRLEIVCGQNDLLCPSWWAGELLERSGAVGDVRLVIGASHQVVVDDADLIVDAALRAAELEPAGAGGTEESTDAQESRSPEIRVASTPDLSDGASA